MILLVISASHPAYLQRFFLKSTIFQILLQHLMVITSHSLTCMAKPRLKRTDPHWQSVLGETKVFPSLPVSSMYAMWHWWYSAKNVACCAFCILRESCLNARQNLVTILDEYTFTCGATLSDLELSDSLSDVCVRDLQCYDPLEKLYFSMNYNPICIHCCSEDNLVSVQGCYPQCESCKHKEPVKKRVWNYSHVKYYFV